MILFAFDFDLTITSKHVHNTIRKKEGEIYRSLDDKEKLKLIKKISTIGKAKHWKKIFKKIIKQKYHIGIVSFNAYPDVISLYLKEVLKLDKKTIQKITIMTPSGTLPENKNGLIEEVLKEKNLGNGTEVILIDDSMENKKDAEAAGIKTILAKEDGSHLRQVQSLLKGLRNKLKQFDANWGSTETIYDDPKELKFLDNLVINIKDTCADIHSLEQQDLRDLLKMSMELTEKRSIMIFYLRVHTKHCCSHGLFEKKKYS